MAQLNMEQRDLRDLYEMSRNIDVHRVGASKDMENLNRRRRHYERIGYSGRMYYARTSNMQSSEDILLDRCGGKCYGNIQKTSNVPAAAGYVYVLDEVAGYDDEDFYDDYEDDYEHVRSSRMAVPLFSAPMWPNNFVHGMVNNNVPPPWMIYPTNARAMPVQVCPTNLRDNLTHTQVCQQQFHGGGGYMWANGHCRMPPAHAGMYMCQNGPRHMAPVQRYRDCGGFYVRRPPCW